MKTTGEIQGRPRMPGTSADVSARFNTFIYAESESSGVNYLIVVRGERLDSKQGGALIHDAEALSSKPNVEVYRYEGDEGRPFSKEQLGDFRPVDPGSFSASGLRMQTYRRYTNLTMPEIGTNSVAESASRLTAATAVHPRSYEGLGIFAPPHPSHGALAESLSVPVETVRPGQLPETRYKRKEPMVPPSSLALGRPSKRETIFMPVVNVSSAPAEEDGRKNSGGVVIDIGDRSYWVKGGEGAEFDAIFKKDGGFKAAFVSALSGKTVVGDSGHELTLDEKLWLADEVRDRAVRGPLGSVRIIDPDRSPPPSWQKYASLIRKGDGNPVEGEELCMIGGFLLIE